MSSRRYIACCAAGFAALFAAAGTATAVVEGRIFQVGQHGVANLAGTGLLCQAGTREAFGRPVFLCATYSARGIPVKGSYAVKVGEDGVSLDRIVSANGESRPVSEWRDP